MQRESPLFPRPLFHPVPENAFSLSLSLSLSLSVYMCMLRTYVTWMSANLSAKLRVHGDANCT